MDAPELMEWAEFDEAHIPESWYQTALICLTVARAFGGATSATLDDFLPHRKRPTAVRADSPADLKARFAAFRARHNARIAAAPNPTPNQAAPCPPSPSSTSN
jgi:hypothetical protein